VIEAVLLRHLVQGATINHCEDLREAPPGVGVEVDLPVDLKGGGPIVVPVDTVTVAAGLLMVASPAQMKRSSLAMMMSLMSLFGLWLSRSRAEAQISSKY
jgi:hypothetical protein